MKNVKYFIMNGFLRLEEYDCCREKEEAWITGMSGMRTTRHPDPIIITSQFSSHLSLLCFNPLSFHFLSLLQFPLNPLLPFHNLLKNSQISLMECTLGLFRHSSASGSAINDSNPSTMDILHKDFVGKVPIDSSPSPASSDLELGLGLALGGGGKVNGGGGWGERGRILTAQDFPVHGGSSSSSSSSSSRFHGRETNASVAVSGTKRAADSAPNEGGSPTALNQVVGWPPIRTYRMNSLVNQAKTVRAEEEVDVDVVVVCEEKKDQYKDNKTCDVDAKGHLGFVKVNVDGVVIGRKVDLNAHSCYETLALMLEDMFFRSIIPNGKSGDKEQARKLSKLLDGSSEFVLTYEDREGDWMLVGDVPWGMFLSSVRRLRIMRTSEANGLAPRSQVKKVKQRSKPI